MKFILHIALIFSLIQAQFAQAVGPTQFKFNAYEVTFLNGFKDSHQFFKSYMGSKTTPMALAEVVKGHIQHDAAFPLPLFSLLKTGEIEFQFQNNKYTLKREGPGKFRLNGQKFDLMQKDWQAHLQQSPIWWESLFIPKAEAVAPIVYILAAVIVGTLIACAAPDTSVLHLNEIKAKHIHVYSNEFNTVIKTIKSGFCAIGCAACADELNNFDYSRYFSNFCGEIAKNYKTQEELNSSTQSFEPIVNPRQMRRSLFMAQVSKTSQQLKTTEIQTIPDLSDQKIVAALKADSEFMKTCVGEFVNSPQLTPGNNTHPEGEVQRAQ